MSRFAALQISLGVLFFAMHIVLMVLAWRRSNGRAWWAFRLLITAETLRGLNSLGWMWARANVIDVNFWSCGYLVTTPFVIVAALLLATELTKSHHHGP
jgi:hypothetical protein